MVELQDIFRSVQAAQVWTVSPNGRNNIIVLSSYASSPTPACTLPAFNGKVLNTCASQKQLGLSQRCVCPVFPS